MDEAMLRKIVAAVDDSTTLAMVACCCRLMRRLAAEEQAERGHCPHLRRLLGLAVPTDSTAQARAAAILGGSFRRQLLLDLAEAQARNVAYDGRQHSYDLVSLPDRGAFLERVELVAADLQHILLYSGSLRVLAALSFVDRPAGTPGGSGSRRPRLFCSILSSVLVRAPLRLGLLFLEPPLLVGAADHLLAPQLAPVAREQLAVLAGAARWRQRFGPDDDVHILWQSLVRRIPSFAVAAGSLHGCLDSSLARTVATHGPLALRHLDISGSGALSDAAIAGMLRLCPQLRVLHALDSKLGPASLAVLAGRAAQPTEQRGHGTSLAKGAQEGQQRRQHDGQHAPAGRPRGGAAAAASAPTSDASVQAEAAFASLHLGPSEHTVRPAAPTGRPAAAAGGGGEAAALPAQPACPLLERLAVGGSGCQLSVAGAKGSAAAGAKGSALRRALRCSPNLTDLRLHGCEVHAVLGPLSPSTGSSSSKGGGSKSSSSKAAAVGHLVGQLRRLELMDCDDLAPAHVAVLLQHCTSLRQLALGSKQLAADQFDRQQHSSLGRHDSCSNDDGSSSSGGSSRSSALTHLSVGWGAGGTFLVHTAQLAPYLTSLTAHVGAAVADSQLAAVADSCRHLQRLCLQAANISDDGVTCVLERCPRLTSLQLHNCVGPLTDHLGTACTARRGTAFKLRELHLSWGASQLSDEGLAALLHPDVARLQSMVLKGCSRLTDAAWNLIAQHRGSLECLAIESCGTAAAAAKAAAQRHAPMTAVAAVEALGSCRALLALTVRLCTAPWTAAEMEQLRGECTALQTLWLDA